MSDWRSEYERMLVSDAARRARTIPRDRQTWTTTSQMTRGERLFVRTVGAMVNFAAWLRRRIRP